MSDDQQPATAGTENEDEPADAAGLPRRRLLQALGGAAGLATIGLSENGPIEPARAQSDGSDDWTQQQRLIPEDWNLDDQFGGAVSVSGDGTTALIGAEGDVGG